MPPVAIMADKKPVYCSYTGVKIDSDVLLIARAAAALAGQRMQDWLSDLVNEHGSPQIHRKPIARKPPPPGKKRGPKSSGE